MEAQRPRIPEGPCIQEKYSEKNACFGCGPANPDGLHIRSFYANENGRDELIAEWKGQKKYEAFPDMLNGGITGALLDCHSNWAAAYFLMKRDGEDKPPYTVTADFHVTLKRPTPSNKPLFLRAWTVDMKEDRATIEASIEADGKITATCKGTFVAVKPGHPAYHRW